MSIFYNRSRRTFFLLGITLVGLLYALPIRADDKPPVTGFVDKVFQDDAGAHKYVVFVPANYTPEKKWPVILFLHGAGERGTDGRVQLTVGLGPVVKKRATSFPFIVVFPQCEDTKGRILKCWQSDAPDGKRALKILDQVEKDYRVDPNHEILTGWSMGGYGTWSLGSAESKRWEAVVPIAGGGQPEWAPKLKEVPVWAIHGSKDVVVRPVESQKMVEALKAAGGNVRYDEVKGAGHDVWKVAYDNSDLYRWMLDPNSTTASKVALRVKPGHRAALKASQDEPFVPALEISRAVYVRLGNEMLKALSVSVPKAVPRDALQGRLNDLYDSITVDGRSFSIAFTGISYSANLTQASIRAYRKDRLNIQLGLEDAVLSIGTTYVTGRDHSAVAGPISVVLGHRRPVWLSFDVTPYVENRKLRLKLVSTRFDIPGDNWYVTSPAGVSTQGFGMTREKVSNGLVSGIYGSKGRIEREITAIVPKLLKQVEAKLDVMQAAELVQDFWPLPVYRPRVRVWPQEVLTDKNGISVVVGVTAASVDPRKTPSKPKKIEGIGRPVAEIPQSTQLKVGVAAGILRPLTNMLIESDMARIHILDIPEKTFAALAERKSLAEAIPDLKQYGDDVEIWSELILTKPMAIADVPGKRVGTTSDQTLEFQIPRILLSLALKTDPDSKEWTPYAEFEIQVAQQARGEVVAPNRQTRALKLAWSSDPEIEVTGRFAPGYTPQNPTLQVSKIKEMFTKGWEAWTQKGPVSQTIVPDVEFGLSKLRLKSFGWNAPYLGMEFGIPGVKLTNSSKAPLVYETKGPISGWGGPYTLEPGKTHDFEISYPLTYRRRTNGKIEMFTLPAGSHSEFRVPVGGGSVQLFEARENIPEPEPKPSQSEKSEATAAATSGA